MTGFAATQLQEQIILQNCQNRETLLFVQTFDNKKRQMISESGTILPMRLYLNRIILSLGRFGLKELFESNFPVG